MSAMAEIYDIRTFRARAGFGKEQGRTGVRSVAPARRDQVVISFEAGRAALERWKAREGVKKHPAYTLGRRSVSPANEQTERLRSGLENQIIQELAAIQAAGKAQNAASPGQEPGGLARTRQEETHRKLLQKAEKNLAAEWRRRNAFREAAGWVYVPELLRYLKLGGGGEDNRFGLTHPKNESVGFLQLLFEFFFGLLVLFDDEEEKKSGVMPLRWPKPDRCFEILY